MSGNNVLIPPAEKVQSSGNYAHNRYKASDQDAATHVRLAIVHDYLLQMGGAERVVAAMAQAFPGAPVYTSATDDSRLLPEFIGKKIRNTWMHSLPGIRQHFKKYFPIYPFAFRSLPPVKADVVWISSSGFAKWIRVANSSKTICYCHTPPRFFWDSDLYLNGEIRNSLVRESAKTLLSFLREWDFDCAQRIDRFIANSRCVQERIWRCYRRPSAVIHPPVNVDRFSISTPSGDYHLVLSRLVGYKRIDLAVHAFNRLRKKLVIIGDGPDRARLESLAGPTISFLGTVGDADVKKYLEGCQGLIFPGLEDFGIAPVEAQAAGKPVVAFAGGGALETVEPEVTGVLVPEQKVEALVEAILRSQRIRWCPETIRANALKFSRETFVEKTQVLIRAVDQEPRRRTISREHEAVKPARESYGV
jgi:glycosyltransferase involved in cell wall biosynthesis